MKLLLFLFFYPMFGLAQRTCVFVDANTKIPIPFVRIKDARMSNYRTNEQGIVRIEEDAFPINCGAGLYRDSIFESIQDTFYLESIIQELGVVDVRPIDPVEAYTAHRNANQKRLVAAESDTIYAKLTRVIYKRNIYNSDYNCLIQNDFDVMGVRSGSKVEWYAANSQTVIDNENPEAYDSSQVYMGIHFLPKVNEMYRESLLEKKRSKIPSKCQYAQRLKRESTVEFDFKKEGTSYPNESEQLRAFFMDSNVLEWTFREGEEEDLLKSEKTMGARSYRFVYGNSSFVGIKESSVKVKYAFNTFYRNEEPYRLELSAYQWIDWHLEPIVNAQWVPIKEIETKLAKLNFGKVNFLIAPVIEDFIEQHGGEEN